MNWSNTLTTRHYEAGMLFTLFKHKETLLNFMWLMLMNFYFLI